MVSYMVNWIFPEVKFVQENNSAKQAIHVFSEAEEARAEFCQEKLDEEMADLLHSCETYFRIRQKEGLDIYKQFKSVITKNAMRGYYDLAKHCENCALKLKIQNTYLLQPDEAAEYIANGYSKR